MVFLHAYGTSDLEIGEAEALRLAQEVGGNGLKAVVSMQTEVHIMDSLELMQEPAVDLGKVMDAVYGVTVVERFFNHEYTLVGRGRERMLHIVDLNLLVVDKTVHALPYHAEALLDCLLEIAADGHHLTHRLHAGLELATHFAELAEIPARNLAHHIVKRRLEESRRGLGHGIGEFEKPVSSQPQRRADIRWPLRRGPRSG